MKLTTFILLIAFVQVSASVYSQTKLLNLKAQNSTIESILKEIEQQSEFFFLYNHEQIDVQQKVNIDFKDKPVEDILSEMLDGTDIDYLVKDRQIVLYGGDLRAFTHTTDATAEATQQKIQGNVVDADGLPLPGVTVLIKGTTHGTVTDVNGSYSISGVSSETTLVFSFVGMRSREVLVGDQTSIDVKLLVDAIGIEEVVTIAYGTTKKAAFTGSAAFIASDKLQDAASSNLSSAIQGLSPGVQIISNSGKPGADASIQIRGFGSMSAANDPLIILNGIAFDGTLSSIAPNEIESMSILKDAASTSLYGSRAANGVILITTKKGKAGKTVINFKSTWGTSDFAVDLPEKLSSDQQYEAVWEGLFYDYLVAGKLIRRHES